MADFKMQQPKDTHHHKGSTYLYRWIPFCKSSKQLRFSALHGESDSHSANLLNYSEFTTVCHVTDLMQARRILEDDVIPTERQLLPQWVETKSVRSSVVRLVQNTEEQMKAAMLAGDDCAGRTRDVKFVLVLRGDEGIVDDLPSPYRVTNPNDDIYHWRHYILDITDYTDVSMCRILVTRRYYSHLLQYESTVLGGPWYWDTTSRVHYHLRSILGFDGKRRPLVLEFWRESEPVGVSKPGFDWSVIQDIEFVRGNISDDCSLGRDPELFLLAWLHSRPRSDVTKFSDIRGLSESKLKTALFEALKETRVPSKNFSDGDFSVINGQKNNLDKEVLEILQNGDKKIEKESTDAFGTAVKACLSLLSQTEDVKELAKFLSCNFSAAKAIIEWTNTAKNWA